MDGIGSACLWPLTSVCGAAARNPDLAGVVQGLHGGWHPQRPDGSPRKERQQRHPSVTPQRLAPAPAPASGSSGSGGDRRADEGGLSSDDDVDGHPGSGRGRFAWLGEEFEGSG